MKKAQVALREKEEAIWKVKETILFLELSATSFWEENKSLLRQVNHLNFVKKIILNEKQR